jgi:hypothetical protein
MKREIGAIYKWCDGFVANVQYWDFRHYYYFGQSRVQEQRFMLLEVRPHDLDYDPFVKTKWCYVLWWLGMNKKILIRDKDALQLELVQGLSDNGKKNAKRKNPQNG